MAYNRLINGDSEVLRDFLQSALLVVLVSIAVYIPALRGEFVYDDLAYVVNNPAVNSPTLSNVFLDTFPPQRRDTGLYRPLLTLSYVVDRISSGWGPGHLQIAHVHNILLHAGVCVALLALLRGWVGRGASLAATMLYACHPVLAESVAWVTGRSEILLAACCVAGLIVLRGRALRDGVKAVCLAGLALCAVLAKESGVVIPLIWVAARRLYAGHRRGEPSLLRLLGPALCIVVVSLVARGIAFGRLSPELQAYAGYDNATRYHIVFMAFVRYVQLLVLPINQSIHWPPYPMQVSHLLAISGLLLFVLIGVGAVLGLGRRRLWGFGLAWFMIAWLPYGNVIMAIGSIMAERFLYLPAMGIACVCAALLDGAGGRARRWMWIVIVAMIVSLGVATFQRSRVWRNDVELWRAALKTYPDDLVAQVASAYYLVKRGNDADYEDLLSWWPEALDGLSRFAPGTLSPQMAGRIQWIQEQLMQHEADRHNERMRSGG